MAKKLILIFIVAASCIKYAYGLTSHNIDSAANLSTDTSASPPKVSESQRMEAEGHKNKGNEYLTAKKADFAVEEYTKAIELDPENAVYYSNRAAAFTMQEDYSSAIEDGMAAVSLNPKYAKAYGRLGAAYLAVNNVERAMEMYKKALELEPDNTSYKVALEQAKAKSSGSSPKSTSPSSPQPGARGQAGPGLDFASLMNNPDIMNMASQMMNNPEAMRNMMNNPNIASMMQNMMGGRDGGGGSGSTPPAFTEEEEDS